MPGSIRQTAAPRHGGRKNASSVRLTLPVSRRTVRSVVAQGQCSTVTTSVHTTVPGAQVAAVKRDLLRAIDKYFDD